MASRTATSAAARGKQKDPPAAVEETPRLLGQIELTQQPEAIFYKDEGGQKWYYLFVFFVVRGEQTPELKRAYDRVADGRRRIPIDCTLLYDGTLEPVADQSILNLLGSSREEMDASDGTPDFDVSKGTGSIRYRINKVSLRKDNQGFRLKIQLRGLEDIIEPVITEATQVFSKRKRLRKEHREPEQQKRRKVEVLARRRNEEVERLLARQSMQSTPLIHRVLSDNALTRVPEYPEMRQHAEDGEMLDDLDVSDPSRHNKRLRGAEADSDLSLPPPPPEGIGSASAGRRQGVATSDTADQLAHLQKHTADLENRLRYMEGKFDELMDLMQSLVPSYTPEGEGDSGTGTALGAPLEAPLSDGKQDDRRHEISKPSMHLSTAPSLPLAQNFFSLLKNFSTSSGQQGQHHHDGGSLTRAGNGGSGGFHGSGSSASLYDSQPLVGADVAPDTLTTNHSLQPITSHASRQRGSKRVARQ